MQIIPKWVEPPTCLKDCFRNYKALRKNVNRSSSPELFHKDVLEVLHWMEAHRHVTLEQIRDWKVDPKTYTDLVWDVIALACETYTREEL